MGESSAPKKNVKTKKETSDGWETAEKRRREHNLLRTAPIPYPPDPHLDPLSFTLPLQTLTQPLLPPDTHKLDIDTQKLQTSQLPILWRKKRIVFYDASHAKQCKGVNSWDKLIKVNAIECRKVPLHFNCVIADPQNTSRLKEYGNSIFFNG